MTIEMMRDIVAKRYIPLGWKKRVSKMPDKQIIAIYYRMLESGELKKKRFKNQVLQKAAVGKDESYIQLTIFDILKGENDDR